VNKLARELLDISQSSVKFRSGDVMSNCDCEAVVIFIAARPRCRFLQLGNAMNSPTLHSFRNFSWQRIDFGRDLRLGEAAPINESAEGQRENASNERKHAPQHELPVRHEHFQAGRLAATEQSPEFRESWRKMRTGSSRRHRGRCSIKKRASPPIKL